MPRTRTLTQLIADVRERADIENSTHISDTEITRYVNQGIAQLHAMIVDQNEDEFAVEVTKSVASGDASMFIVGTGGDTPPASVYKVLAVDRIATDGTSCPVRRFTLQERALLDSAGANGSPFRSMYRLRGLNTVLFSPPIDTATSIRVTYIEASADLKNPGDYYDGRDGWEEWVTLDAAIRCLIKEESDTSDLVRERAMVEQRITKQMATRDQAEPHRMRDVAPWIVEKW